MIWNKTIAIIFENKTIIIIIHLKENAIFLLQNYVV